MRDVVLRCLEDDPRGGRGFDDRGRYLADLVELAAMPLAPFGKAARLEDEDVAELARAVLESLAARGSAEAAALLPPGPEDECESGGGRGEHDALREEAAGASGSLLVSTARGTDVKRARYALVALGERGDPGLIELVLDLLSRPDLRPGVRNGALLGVRRLPSELCVPFARRSLGASGPAGLIAHCVLGDHAQPQDAPALRAALASAAGDVHLELSCVKALARCTSSGASPELEALYERVYSFYRIMVVEALAAVDAERFATVFAHECLWDCEDATVATAAAHVRRDERGVAERLRTLASDPAFELAAELTSS